MEEFTVVGKRLPRVDAVVKATGEAMYAADMELPGMLHGKMLRSPHPHARILNIDTGRAERLQGVKAVVTAKDTLGYHYGDLILGKGDEPFLATEKVRFVGDEVAAVAAVDEDTAEEALQLIDVEYELLPAVFDPLEAMEEGAPLLHEHAANNIACKSNMRFGDVEAGFRRSECVREDRFETQPVCHAFLEPHAALASYDSTGKITFWGSKQSPYFTYRNMPRALGLELSKVRIVQPYIGGGFGGKNEMFSLDFTAALLSMKTGKPVKIVYSQEEVLSAGRQRNPTIMDIKTGVGKDGTIMAIKCRIVANGGAYISIGRMTMYLMGSFLALPYRVPNIEYDGYRVYTNNQVCCAQRGHGVPQVRYAAESQLDMIARELDIDPLDIRLKNALQPGDNTVNGFRITSCGLTECLQKAGEIKKWREEWGELPPNKKRGIGFGAYGFVSGPRVAGHNTAGAMVKVHEDGAISVLTGSTDSGQGSDSCLSQIAAEVLGLGLDKVRLVMPDSEVTPLDPGTFGSRVTFVSGNAVWVAADDARKQLAEVGAELLGAHPEELVFRNEQVFVRDDPEKNMPFTKLVKSACYSGTGRTIMGRGYFAPELEVPNYETGEGNVSATYSFGAQAAEVEVDTDTGKVRVTRMKVLHDCGRAINPMHVEGQLEGSVCGGLGQALLEDKIKGKDTGQAVNPSFMEYKLPSAVDMPDIESEAVETIDPVGPFGAKESGEGVQVSTVPAITNAVYDALGVMVKTLPVTPEKILNALEKENEE